LSPGHLGYFQGRLRNKLYSALMQLFLDEKKLGFTRADLARRRALMVKLNARRAAAKRAAAAPKL
jgi:hypothetical protein